MGKPQIFILDKMIMQWLDFIVKQLELMANYVKASAGVCPSFTRNAFDNPPNRELQHTSDKWPSTLK